MISPVSQIRDRQSATRNALTRSLPLAVLTLLTAFCLVHSALGQSTSATLSGAVADQNGAAIPGVTVTIVNKGTQATREATTNDEGYFTVPLLQPGNYIVRARRDGFAPVDFPDVVLNVGDQKALKIQLKAGDVNATVTVDSNAETIRTDGSVGTVVNRQFVANMPLNGRSLQSLISLTPGVVFTSVKGGSVAGGQFSVNGQRSNANYFTVDGVSANYGISTVKAEELSVNQGPDRFPALLRSVEPTVWSPLTLCRNSRFRLPVLRQSSAGRPAGRYNSSPALAQMIFTVRCSTT